MNKSTIKMTLIASTIFFICGGSYFGYKKLNSIQSKIDDKIELVSKGLPKHYEIKEINKSFSLLKTKGSYEISYKNNIDKEYNGSILIEYNIPHTFDILLGKDISFNGNVKLDGSFLKTLNIKTNKKEFDLVGNISKDGELLLNYSIDDLSLSLPYLNNFSSEKNPLDLKISKTEINTKISSNIENLTNSVKMNKIKLLEGKEESNIKELLFNYNGDLSNLLLGKLNIKLSDFDNQTKNIKVKELAIDNAIIKGKKDKNLHDLLTKIKVKDLNQNGVISSISFDGKVNSLSTNMLNIYNNLIPTYFSKNYLAKNDKNFTDSLKNGFSLTINEFTYSNDTNDVNIKGNIGINTYNLDMEYLLSKTAYVILDLESKGDLLPNMLGIENKLETKLSIDFNDTTLKINNEIIDDEIAKDFTSLINNIGIEIGLNK